MTFGIASLRRTITSLWPSRSLPSSRTSAIPLMRPSLTSSAIFSAKLSGLTWYGSSVTTKHVRLFISSTSTTARIMIEPRPVRYASSMPWRPTIKALVGKSGPFTIVSSFSNKSFGSASGFSSDQTTPSTTSFKLCGGIFVAIPTAIPALPFTRRFGKRLGRTVGSCDLPS